MRSSARNMLRFANALGLFTKDSVSCLVIQRRRLLRVLSPEYPDTALLLRHVLSIPEVTAAIVQGDAGDESDDSDDSENSDDSDEDTDTDTDNDDTETDSTYDGEEDEDQDEDEDDDDEEEEEEEEEDTDSTDTDEDEDKDGYIDDGLALERAIEANTAIAQLPSLFTRGLFISVVTNAILLVGSTMMLSAALHMCV